MYVLLSVTWLTVGFEVFSFLEFKRVGSEVLDGIEEDSDEMKF
jgi:hypothetical protein